MNRKTTYLIPAFVAVFALMFTVATPLAMAEYGEGIRDKGIGQKHHKVYKVIEVDSFVGSIQISEDLDKQALRDQVSVSLSEAADGLDVLGGHVGVAVNENGEKYLVWALKSVERDSDSETVTATIYVVDAGDATNTTSMTKEFDRSHKIEKKIDKISNKIERLSQSSGDADIDAARAAFVEKFQEIKEALESGDSERASELRDELKDLRSELGNIKSYRK